MHVFSTILYGVAEMGRGKVRRGVRVKVRVRVALSRWGAAGEVGGNMESARYMSPISANKYHGVTTTSVFT